VRVYAGGVRDAESIVRLLRLAPHPEGGFYRETFRASARVGTRDDRSERTASTAIYFLLPAGAFSALHRVRSDEVWHHYDGDAVDLHEIDAAGDHTVARLGRNWDAGERPQIVVAAGVWQAAVPVGREWSLCGCTVAPGFDFADFEMPPRNELLARFPGHRELIEKLSRA
jgi:predicted cupin superfamily sugar epimerase